MSTVEKTAVMARVETMAGCKRQALSELGIARSTYYRWRQWQRGDGLEPHSGGTGRPWNRITPKEEGKILAAARESPEVSSRQLATWITDNTDFAVSESTVYRILRREGLVKRPEVQLMAGKEYHTKTTGPHQLWATDASYFRVVGWGYYYLVTVMDDYSRFILAWRLQRDMAADSLIEVIQEAIDATGMTEVPIEDRTKLLSDNGAGYVSRAFRDYLHLVGIRHILAAPFHPQTNGKLERYHQTIKREVNQIPYELPEPAGEGYRRLCRILQLPPVPQSTRRRDARRCPSWQERADPTAQKGGTSTHNRTPKRLQPDPQGASSPL